MFQIKATKLTRQLKLQRDSWWEAASASWRLLELGWTVTVVTP